MQRIGGDGGTAQRRRLRRPERDAERRVINPIWLTLE